LEASGNLFGRAAISQMRPHTLAIVHNVWPQASPDSRFHVLRHSCGDRISFAWQHRSPSGPVM
jgi:hypothetical protein